MPFQDAVGKRHVSEGQKNVIGDNIYLVIGKPGELWDPQQERVDDMKYGIHFLRNVS